MDLNKVMLIGRLTRDPEVRTTGNGINVSSFGLATGFTWTDASGQRQERTEFHNVVAWRKLGEIVAKYLKKGSQVYIEGRLQTRSWDDPATSQKKYRTEVVVDNMIMLGRPTGSGPTPTVADNAPPAGTDAPPKDEIPIIEISNEDMPF